MKTNCTISEMPRTLLWLNNVKLYVPFVILPINDNIKFAENIKQGFKTTISWNKYRSEVTIQPKNNNLDDLIQHLEKLIDYLYFHSKMVIISYKKFF